ncbi:MAG: photosynthetic complex assembly protein PuhC [Pseudomonadota bacterium]
MSDTTVQTTASKPVWFICAGIIAIVAMVGVARLAGFDPTQSGEVTVVESRDVLFMDTANGGVSVIDNETGSQLRELAPGTNGFLRATLRGLAKNRMTRGFGPDVPFRVARTSTGMTQLTDLATGRTITLDAFGQTNTQVFAKLLSTGAN